MKLQTFKFNRHKIIHPLVKIEDDFKMFGDQRAKTPRAQAFLIQRKKYDIGRSEVKFRYSKKYQRMIAEMLLGIIKT